MTTKPEVDAYVQEQWRLKKIAGDWRQTAEEFFVFGERVFWKFSKTWQSMCDSYVATGKRRADARLAGSKKPQGGHTLVVCTLCWRIHDAHNEDRGEGQQLAECGCAERTKASQELWRVLKACQRFVTLCFEVAAPPSALVQEKIWRARQRATVDHADEYERHTAAWFDALGGGHAEQSAA
ncbi:MAG: hypothetical protein NTV22_11420 [bacterium]|nr:hypothetical protein [bacterium]